MLPQTEFPADGSEKFVGVARTLPDLCRAASHGLRVTPPAHQLVVVRTLMLDLAAVIPGKSEDIGERIQET